MGESTTFCCDECGYESAPIRWGVSMLDPRRRYMPAFCYTCRTYVEVDLTGADILVDEFTCPTCGDRIAFIDKGDSYPCPACKGHGLSLRQGDSYW
jgi:Zn finger protein HypA/HybF involved in hydrogenase expression